MATVADGITYAQAVIDGQISPDEQTRLACERFLRDLEDAAREDYPFRFEPERAQRVLDFYGPFNLEGWQVFALVQIFGWIHKQTGLRRLHLGWPKGGDLWEGIPSNHSLTVIGTEGT